jgi:hypothetical protein
MRITQNKHVFIVLYDTSLRDNRSDMCVHAWRSDTNCAPWIEWRCGSHNVSMHSLTCAQNNPYACQHCGWSCRDQDTVSIDLTCSSGNSTGLEYMQEEQVLETPGSLPICLQVQMTIMAVPDANKKDYAQLLLHLTPKSVKKTHICCDTLCQHFCVEYRF